MKWLYFILYISDAYVFDTDDDNTSEIWTHVIANEVDDCSQYEISFPRQTFESGKVLELYNRWPIKTHLHLHMNRRCQTGQHRENSIANRNICSL